MRSLVFLIIVGLYGLVNYYLSTKVITLLNSFFQLNSTYLVRVLFLGLIVSTLSTYLLPSVNVSELIGKLGTYWLGLSLLSLFVVCMTEIILFIVKKFTTTDFTTIGLILDVVLIALIFSYGVWQANQIKVTKYDVSISKKSDLSGLNAVLLTDLHLGYVNGADKLEKVVNQINALKPEIVLISGDLFDGNFEAVQEPQKVLQLLNSIQSVYGSFLVWGNHDAGENFEKMSELIKKSDIILLEDSLFVAENEFAIIGRKDSFPIGNQNSERKEVSTIIKQVSQLPLIILDHRPSNWKEYQAPVDLVLSGHTHQGQVFPLNLITNKLFDVDYGHGQNESGLQIIVSSGAGTWGPPIRVGTKTEIVQLKIEFNN